ncbi:helix-turn-helix domain-containing protein [Plantactinospora sp. WMMB334]|uniref:helix-turn-helix domain-containing protein n=1 Tax=Plantactinospora sp. WMMB334 TaxID=3404119 RepID=UPI003B94584A
MRPAKRAALIPYRKFSQRSSGTRRAWSSGRSAGSIVHIHAGESERQVSGPANPKQVAAWIELGRELRRLRERAGLTGEEIAERLEWSQSKVSRIERARTLPRVADVERLVEALGLTGNDRERVHALAERATSGEWRNSTGVGLTRRQSDFIALEASAREIWHYNPVLLPGYMQSYDYARRVIEMAGAANEERAVEYRLARRATMLGVNAPRYRVLLLETALRWRPVPTEAMAQQLRSVAEYASRDNVELRVVSLDREQLRFIQHPLMIFRFGQPSADRALVETTTGDYHLTEAATVERLRYNFEQLSSSALSLGDSLALIHEATQTLMGHSE